MNIKALIRDNIALNAHPEGCRQQLLHQINEVKNLPKITENPLNILIIGGSTGYGLASRIALAFNSHAYTYSVSFEREPKGRNTGSAGYYNNLFFKELADEAQIPADNLTADAFSHSTKEKVIDDFKAMNRKIDLVIYSLASGIRIDPNTGEKYLSSLKPVGQAYHGIHVDIASQTLKEESLEPATEEEIFNTVKVMGGEDYQLWADALMDANLLNENCTFVTYTYLGASLTDPIYKDGTIGHAKRDLESTNAKINEKLQTLNGRAIISASKAVVTRASVFIPTMALYASALFKVMREKGTHETTVQHKYRLFKEMIYGNKALTDDQGFYRLDSYELEEDVQAEVRKLIESADQDNFVERLDFLHFKHEFLAINGFDIEGVDYEADVEI